MSHISKISIKNYQTHSNTTLDFSRGLNVIHGPSDHGKSSILRSIEWVVCNRPMGDDFRKHGTNGTSVSIIKNSNIIRRRRSDKKNEYKVNDENPHKALRSSVPPDILSKLNISEVNIQPQQDVYFLVHQSPGQRSKILNEVAGLGVMDRTINLTNSEIRKTNSEVKWKNETLSNIESEIKNLEWVKVADVELSELEERKKDIQKIEFKIKNTSKIISEIQKLDKLKEKLFPEKFTTMLLKLIDYRDVSKKVEHHTKIIQALIVKFNSLTEKINAINVIDVSELKKQRISINSVKNKINVIRNLCDEIIEGNLDHTVLYEKIIDTEHEIKDELKQLGICPVCKRKTTHIH